MSITISEINALINKNDWLDDQYSISFTVKWMIFKYRLCSYLLEFEIHSYWLIYTFNETYICQPYLTKF